MVSMVRHLAYHVVFRLFWLMPTILSWSHAFSISSDFEVIHLPLVGGTFQGVTFENSYTSAPVVVCTRTLPSSGVEDAVVRLRNVSTTGFEIKLQKPISSSSVTATPVTCIVAKEGVHTLENGYQFEARKVLSQDTSGDGADGWNGTGENVSSLLAINHGNAPAVLGQVMSYNDAQFSVFWTYNCNSRQTPPTSTSICVGKHIGQTTVPLPDPRATETLGVIVVEGAGGNSGIVGGAIYTVALGADTIDGVDNSGASYSLNTTFSLGIATQNGMDGGDGGWAVFYGANPFGGNAIDLAIDEDELGIGTRPGEPERRHITEQVAYWLFTQDPALSWMEVRKFTNVGGAWQTVSFNNTYTSAVPVCTYHLPSSNDNEAVVRIRNVTASSMQIMMQRPKNSTAVTPSNVYCIIMEEGTHLFDGRKVEARKILSSGTNRYGDWSTAKMTQVSYLNTYTSPVVFGQVMSFNDPNWSAFWCSSANPTNPPSATTLYAGKHIGEEPLSTAVKYRQDETLGFIIGAPHEGFFNRVYYAFFRGSDTILGVGDAPPYSYSFSGLNHTSYTYGVATQNAEDGGNGGWAVLYGTNPVGSKIDLAIDEETVAGDTTRTHVTEQVSYWVFDPSARLSITKRSCVLSDPVRGTSNPMRIPGATIRYVLEVNNTLPVSAQNVLVSDTLPSIFDTATIRNLQVQTGPCDCLGAASASNNPPPGTADGVHPIVLNFGSIAGGSTASPNSECGYFEVDIR